MTHPAGTIISVRFDGEGAGTIEIKDGKQMIKAIRTQPGTYELGLHFLTADKLEIVSVTLN